MVVGPYMACATVYCFALVVTSTSGWRLGLIDIFRGGIGLIRKKETVCRLQTRRPPPSYHSSHKKLCLGIVTSFATAGPPNYLLSAPKHYDINLFRISPTQTSPPSLQIWSGPWETTAPFERRVGTHPWSWHPPQARLPSLQTWTNRPGPKQPSKNQPPHKPHKEQAVTGTATLFGTRGGLKQVEWQRQAKQKVKINNVNDHCVRENSMVRLA